jgi:hypothetical protein
MTNDRLRLVVWCLGMLHMGAHLSALAKLSRYFRGFSFQRCGTLQCPVTVMGDKDGEEL